MKRIRVLLADDHPVVRAGVRAFLESEPDLAVVGEASIGCQAVALAQDLHPDVVIMDVSMPGNGLDATRQIRAACPTTQVVIFTFHNQDLYLLDAVQAGAAGFVLKSAADTELVTAIRAVAEGGAYLSPSSARLVVEEYRAGLENDHAVAHDPLSEREQEVLQLIALGYTASEAAAALRLSPKSVETYRSRIMQKLGLHNRVALVQYALSHNLLNEEAQGL
jgi:two-component system, NarL family, response regulator NreC